MLDNIKIHVGPVTKEADMVHASKYRGKNEDFREAMNRIAAAVQDNHDHYMAYRNALLTMRFMPPGRVQAAMGSMKSVTAFNCFVMGTMHDSFTDGPSESEKQDIYGQTGRHLPTSIMHTAVEAAMTMRQGGGVGYDISTLRPSGDLIRGVDSITRGPLAFAPIYDAVCRATASAGNRRGAQMLVMRCDHPDIEEFIRAKHVSDTSIPDEYRPLRGFNMSVAVTDELMQAVEEDTSFDLKFDGKVYKKVAARDLWEMIMRSTYDWAEPGVLFIDTINRMNNLHYCETIAATNPCGEQPLPPYGACLLGSFNAVKYLVWVDDHFEFNWEMLGKDIPLAVRSTDNVIDRTRYPLPQQKIEAQNKRRIGLGITGLANALEAMGMPYGTPEFVEFERTLMKFIANECYRASAMLAAEKGAFPMYDAEQYLAAPFIQKLDDDVQELIRRYGIRNSHLTSVAPTGTISFSADNVSSGIEPVIAYRQARRIIMPEGPVVVEVDDYGLSFLGVKGRTAMDGNITAEEHINVLCAAQEWVDSACSKTVNVPKDTPYDKFKDLYMMAWKGGAKGCTTYRPNGAYDDVIKSVDPQKEKQAAEAEEQALDEDGVCGFDPVTGQRTGVCAD